PMTDANLVRVLQQQTRRKVGLVNREVVSAGAGAIAERFALLRRDGFGFAIVDAITDNDLRQISSAAATMKLITGGSGLAQGLPQNFARLKASSATAPAKVTFNDGFKAVIAGSCSTATQSQVEVMRAQRPSF